MNTTENKSNVKSTSLVNYAVICGGLLIGTNSLQAQDNIANKNLRLQNIPKIMKDKEKDVVTKNGAILLLDVKMKTKARKLDFKKEGELSTKDKEIPAVNGANTMKLRL